VNLDGFADDSRCDDNGCWWHVQGKINRLCQLLHRHDPGLSAYFDAMNLDARYYSLRWITTLLSR
jgi:hypothetical protein